MTLKHTSRRYGRQGPIARAAGFTMIELMIAIGMGLAIVAGLAGMLASTSSSSRTNDRTSELETNGVYALNAIKQDLRQAGYRGYTWAEPNAVSTALGTITGECGDGTGKFITNLRQGIWGANDSNPFSTTCIPDKPADAGGDVLVVRRLDGTPVATPVANTLYFRSTYNAGEVFRGATPPATVASDVLPLANFPLQASVYYVRPYTTAATENPLVPALYRVVLLPNGSMARELVTTNIEQLQVQYGRLTTALDTRYFDSFTAANCASCTLDTGAAITSTPTVWDEINSVRIWILVRSATPEPGYANNTSYVMGDKTYAVNDNYRRQLLTAVVQLRN
jgi:type IV pilus assembly protein PilW